MYRFFIKKKEKKKDQDQELRPIRYLWTPWHFILQEWKNPGGKEWSIIAHWMIVDNLNQLKALWLKTKSA